MSSSLFRCQLFDVAKKTDFSGDYNPGNILHNYRLNNDQTINIDNYEYRFDYYTKDETDTIINDYVPGETYFINISEEEMDTTGNSFEYYVNKQLLLGATKYYLTFYKNGYAKVKTNDKDLPSYYYYKFNADTANRLYNKVYSIVDAHRQEELDKKIEESRCKEELATFSLQSLIDYFNNTETLKFSYTNYSSDYAYGITLEDDGVIKELLLNATYDSVSSNGNGTSNGHYIRLSDEIKDEQDNVKSSFSFSLYENTYIISAIKAVTDKYERAYSKTLYFNIGRTTTHAIFDKIIALYEEATVEMRKTQARLDNYSMDKVINDIKELDPFTFYYIPSETDGGRKELTDDGGVKDLLSNANYTVTNYRYSYDVTPAYKESITIYYKEVEEDNPNHVLFSYYCDIYTDGYIELSLFAEDVTHRYHYQDKYFNIDKGTSVALFNKAHALYETNKNE